MKVAENFSMLFYLEKSETSKTGLIPIYVRITVNGKRNEFSTGMKINPGEWNHETMKMEGKSPGALAINNQLTQIQANLQKHFLILTTQHEFVTVDMVKNAYKNPDGAAKEKLRVEEEKQQKAQELKKQGEEKRRERTLCKSFNYKFSIFKRQVKAKLRSNNSLQKLRTLKTKIREFCQHQLSSNDIALAALEPKHGTDFLNFLTLDQELQPNTARKYVKQAKELLSISVERGWLAKNPWQKVKTGYDQPNRECLTMQEIYRLQIHPLNSRLDYVRDIFLFACFTGYAFNELNNFKKSDIIVGDDGKRWIKIDRKKTGNPECVPLLPIPEAIINKYWNDPYCVNHNKLIPLRSLTHYNGYLKEIASIFDINLELSSHIARHTFATTICLDNGVPIATISKLLGHKNIRTTMIYLHITKRKISRDMNLLESILFDENGELMAPKKVSRE